MNSDAASTSGFVRRRADGFLSGQRPWRQLADTGAAPLSPLRLALIVAASRLHRRELTAAIQALADMSGRPGIAAALHGLSKGDVDTAEALLAGQAATLASENRPVAAARHFRHVAAFHWLTDPATAQPPLDQALDLLDNTPEGDQAPDEDAGENAGEAVTCRRMRTLLAAALNGDADDMSALLADAAAAEDQAAIWAAMYRAVCDDTDFGPVQAVAGTVGDPVLVAWVELFAVRFDAAALPDLPPDADDPVLSDLLAPPGPDGWMARLQPYLPRMLGYAVLAIVVVVAALFVTGRI